MSSVSSFKPKNESVVCFLEDNTIFEAPKEP
jgi:hypothetical protein